MSTVIDLIPTPILNCLGGEGGPSGKDFR